MKIVFDKNNVLVFAGNELPSSHTDEAVYTIVSLPDAEDFDPRYTYTPVDGLAVKGDLIPIDVVEEARMEAEFTGTQYQRDRKDKYDALNQLELISDDAINGTTTHKDAILAIKAEIPKPTGE
jgi:hypothetical protein